MGRVLGLDIGAIRTGVAISDELNIIATPLVTISTKELLPLIQNWISEYKIEVLVFGEPTNLKGQDSDSSLLVRQTMEKVAQSFPTIKLETVNERFTSKLASRSLVDSGMKKSQRRQKGELDKVSAALILQDYLNY